MSDNVLIGLAIAVCVPLLLGFLSLSCVEQNEYGLKFNWITKEIGHEVYHGGTHFIGFWSSLVVFPATVQTIEFSERIGSRTAAALHTRTKEGLGLHLSVSFQFTLDQHKIPELYALTNVFYEGLFTRIARDQLLEAASDYEGPQYWLMRQKIGDHMRRLVDEKLAEAHASLWGLQLLVIDLPDRYENSITMTQVQQQIIKTRENQQVAAGIRADTDVVMADFSRQVRVVQADAQANFTLITMLAKAEAEKRKIAAEADALKYVRGKLGLSAADTVEYQELAAYSTLDNASFMANIPGVMPMVAAGGAGSGLLQRRAEPHVVERPVTSESKTIGESSEPSSAEKVRNFRGAGSARSSAHF